ncbi:MAG: hypothetical protein K9H84_00850 [Bacteroidales bacterium]|nr:hypothetical protein [Bacteroidales bacterium]
MKQFPYKVLFWITVFGIAFAMVETAIVIYLRELYYPEGFDFPLQLISIKIVNVELFRELATLFLLLSVAVIAGKTARERFAWFLYSFAIWDIFYYVFLYVFLGWPESLLTWDILFLLPFSWVGPVLAPVINSLIMVFLAMVFIYFSHKKQNLVTKGYHWLILIIGAVIVMVSYMEDYVNYMLQKFTFGDLLGKADHDKLLDFASNYFPDQFNWWLFAVGAGLHVVIVFHIIVLSRRNKTMGYDQLLRND